MASSWIPREVSFALLIFFTLSRPSLQQTCYYPDGSIANTDRACILEGQDFSFCCGQNYACLANKVCSNTISSASGINLVRGSCTDHSWESEFCPNFCTGVDQNDSGGNAMEFCSGDIWLCDSNEKPSNCSTGENTVTLLGGTDALTTIGVAPAVTPSTSSSSSSTTSSSTSTTSTESSSTSTSTSSSTSPTDQSSTSPPQPAAASGTPEASSSSGLSTGAKAGIGIGVPLGVMAIAVIAYFAWRQGRKSATGLRSGVPAWASHPDPSKRHFDNSTMPSSEAFYQHSTPSELPAQQDRRAYEMQ